MMHADTMESGRLKRVRACLADHEWHSTLALVQEAHVCVVECRCVTRGRFEYRIPRNAE